MSIQTLRDSLQKRAKQAEGERKKTSVIAELLPDILKRRAEGYTHKTIAEWIRQDTNGKVVIGEKTLAAIVSRLVNRALPKTKRRAKRAKEVSR